MLVVKIQSKKDHYLKVIIQYCCFFINYWFYYVITGHCWERKIMCAVWNGSNRQYWWRRVFIWDPPQSSAHTWHMQHQTSITRRWVTYSSEENDLSNKGVTQNKGIIKIIVLTYQKLSCKILGIMHSDKYCCY